MGMADGAPQLYDCYKNNIVFNWHAGNHIGADAGFAQAEENGWQRVDIDVVNSRVVINSIETRPMLAGPGDLPDSLDIWCGTQGPVGIANKCDGPVDAIGKSAGAHARCWRQLWI